MSLCPIKLRSSHKKQTANAFPRVMQQTDPKPGARHVLVCRCVQAESLPTVPLSGRHTESGSKRWTDKDVQFSLHAFQPHQGAEIQINDPTDIESQQRLVHLF